MISLPGGSSREFVIANSLSLIFILLLKISIYIGFSTPWISGQRFAITATSVGVAYGVETGVLLLVSGIKEGSVKNEFKDSVLADILKVSSLIIFSYMLLSDTSAAQELLTRVVYFVSLTVYIMVGYVSIASDKDQLSDFEWWELIFFILFLFSPLLIIGVLVSYVAALFPPIFIIIIVIPSVILLGTWYYQVR